MLIIRLQSVAFKAPTASARHRLDQVALHNQYTSVCHSCEPFPESAGIQPLTPGEFGNLHSQHVHHVLPQQPRNHLRKLQWIQRSRSHSVRS